jgi:hypothetical protein
MSSLTCSSTLTSTTESGDCVSTAGSNDPQCNCTRGSVKRRRKRGLKEYELRCVFPIEQELRKGPRSSADLDDVPAQVWSKISENPLAVIARLSHGFQLSPGIDKRFRGQCGRNAFHASPLIQIRIRFYGMAAPAVSPADTRCGTKGTSSRFRAPARSRK